MAHPRPERKSAIVERASFNCSGRWNRPVDAAQRLGNYLAGAEETNQLKAPPRRARRRPAARVCAFLPLGLPRLAHGFLDVVPDAFLHGRSGPLPVPKWHRQLTSRMYPSVTVLRLE